MVISNNKLLKCEKYLNILIRMLQFRLLLNSLCIFEVVTSYWSVTHPSQKFAGTVDIFGKICFWYECILTQFLGKPNCFSFYFLHIISCCVFKVKKSKIVFWFSSNTTIFIFILLWQHVSVNWPLSGHLFKTQNKVQCSANNIFVIWDPIKLAKFF